MLALAADAREMRRTVWVVRDHNLSITMHMWQRAALALLGKSVVINCVGLSAAIESGC